MSDSPLFQAVSRMTAWLRDYGHLKNQVFVGDLRVLVEFGKQKITPSELDVLCTDINGNPFDFSNVGLNCNVSEDGKLTTVGPVLRDSRHEFGRGEPK